MKFLSLIVNKFERPLQLFLQLIVSMFLFTGQNLHFTILSTITFKVLIRVNNKRIVTSCVVFLKKLGLMYFRKLPLKEVVKS